MNWRITTSPSFLTEGLFGQVFLHVFETLPKLYQSQIFPDWHITSLKYGMEPDFLIIPGILDLNYEVKNVETQDIDLTNLREHSISVLGNQWEDLHNLWNAYFRIPTRIVKQADEFGDLSNTLGLHYRGTDKNQDFGHTNPVSHKDFLILINDFINNHKNIDSIFIASDDNPIKQLVRENFKGKRIINTGEVSFWKTSEKANKKTKGDHALLDSLLLSKCKYLLKNQSALSAFAKIFNPKLNAYRISASKLFTDIPYFPDAYIPQLASEDPVCKSILKRLLKDDWTQNQNAIGKFGKPFYTMEREVIVKKRSRFSRLRIPTGFKILLRK